MLLILNNLLFILPFTKWCLIPLGAIAILVFYVIKLRRLSRQLTRSEDINNLIWNNVQEFLFLIDSDYKINRTNFYEINKIPVDRRKERFGEVMNCQYACSSGKCGSHVACSLCLVRKQLKSTFANKSKFSNYEIVMSLCTPSSSQTCFYNVMVSGTYLTLEDKEYVLLTIHDISREKALEKSVKKSHEKFLTVFDNLPVGCAICSKEGILREVNDTYVEYMGIDSKEDAVSKLNIFNNPCVDEELKQMMRKGESVSGEVKYDYEKINAEYVKTNSSSIKYFRFIVDCLRDNKGEIESYVIIWVDNTFIHKTLRKNKAFEDMTSLASEVSNIGFGSVNLINNEQIATPGYLKNLGLTADNHSSALLQYINVHPEERSELINYLEKARIEKVEPYVKDVRIEINKEYHWIRQLIMQQIFDPENDNIALLGVNVDISDRKETERELKEAKEKAESSDKLKSAFIANMSHEIRTPLNAIVGFSSLLVTADSDEEKDNYLKIINHNNELLLQLISDILDLSKIEADTLEFNWSDVDINSLLKDLEQSSRLRMGDNTEVEIKCVMDLPECIINTERTRISQVLTNFLTNAMKFTEKGSIVVGYRKEEDGLSFYVKDTGCGIPEDRLSHVFDRFVKLDNFKQGTGLGLSICCSIVNKLGGEIGVSSVLGEGSEFWFKLPCQLLERPVVRQNVHREKEATSIPVDSGKRHTLLVAEDIEDNYRLCEILLAKKYDLIHAWNGEEAVEMYLKYSPDAILMDIRMPHWDGYEATQAIRQMSKEVPIIAVTAFAFNEDRERILSSGFDACLTKPIKGQELYSALGSFNL